MKKFDDKETRALLGKFFDQAFASIVRDVGDYQKIQNHEAGLRMSHGISFFVDQQMQSAENEIVSTILSKMGPQLGHYVEIASEIWNVAAKCFSEDMEPTDPKLTMECFSKLNNLAAATIQFIHPAYNVVLSEGITEVEIGPVAIRAGLDIASSLSKKTDKITFGSEQPPGFQPGTLMQYNVYGTMWDIQLSSSAAARYEHASWLTCVATTLIRLIVEPGEWGPLPPRRTEVENKPFERHQISSEHIAIGPQGFFSFGGGKAGRWYELGEKAKRSLSSEEARNRIALAFNPIDKTLAQRFSQGIGWLGKGRQATDRSDRFLFFFTALEALLSSDDKTAPVVQTIARHAAVLWTNDISGRLKISRKIRQLYTTRSGLVHAGSRSVTFEGATDIHEIAEGIFLRSGTLLICK